MKHRHLVAAALAAALVFGPAPFALAQHGHGDAHAPSQLTLDHGKRWTTDAPLRRHMGDIRTTMAANLERIHAGTLPAAEYAKIGATVEGKVGSIIADCKLPPEADAMLHVIVADLVAGADIMQGKAQGDRAAGAHKVVTALDGYARYFDDAAFEPLG